FIVSAAHQFFETRIRQEQLNNVPMEKRQWSDNSFAKVVSAVHAALPRTTDISHLCDILIMSDFLTGSVADSYKLHSSDVRWGESLLVSTAYIVLFLGLACWRFSRKDY